MYKRRRITKTRRSRAMRIPRPIGTMQFSAMKSSANYGIRRSFQIVKSLTTPSQGTAGQQTFFTEKLDISGSLTNCPEFNDAVKAYKYYQVKNIRVNVHNFLTVPWGTLTEKAYSGVFPIALAYQGVKDISYESPNTTQVPSGGNFAAQTLPGYAQVLGKQHSKLISFSPDSFSSTTVNTAGRTKEQISINSSGAVAIDADEYGFLTIYYGVNGHTASGNQIATLQIIFDVVVFDN